MSGRISLLVDSPLRDMLVLLRAVPAETTRQITAAGRKDAQPIWQDETRSRSATRLQQAVLVKTARVSVTARNIQLKSATVGKLSTGTPASALAIGAEFGMDQAATITTKSRKGKLYDRRAGKAFGPRIRRGKVIYPAAAASTIRLTSLIVQTCARTLLDALDLKG